MKKSNQNPATCNCCEGIDVLTPVRIFNRPGLNAIGYRVGTHGSFLETMKARLSSSAFAMLAQLTTRESRDASIALLDAWATAADVLTFYQERIANEGYLRTAIERRSILELARLVGYRLRPGLAASVYLAYTLEPTQPTTVIEIGNKAQSIPGPNEKPQVFETAEKLIAYSGLNLMKPRLTQPQFVSLNQLEQMTLVVKGASLNLRVNDGILLQFTMLDPFKTQTAFYRVTAVTLAPELNLTILKLNIQGPAPAFVGKPVNTQAMVFDAVKAMAKYLAIEAFGLSPTAKTVEKASTRLRLFTEIVGTHALDPQPDALVTLQVELPMLLSYMTSQYALAFSRGWDRIAIWLAEIITGLGEVKQLLVLVGSPTAVPLAMPIAPPGLPSFAELFQPFKLPQSVQPAGEARLSRHVSEIFGPRSEFVARMYAAIQPQTAEFVEAVLSNASQVQAPTPSREAERVTELTRAQALRLRTSLAGHNMPLVVQTPTSGISTTLSPPTLGAYIGALKAAGLPAELGQNLSQIALDAEYDQIKVGSQIVIRHPTVDGNGATNVVTSIHNVTNVTVGQMVFSGVAFSCTILTLATPWLTAAETTVALSDFNAIVRNTTVFAQSEDLTLAETEIADDLSFSASDLDPIIELDGLYSNLEPGRWIIISGERVVIDTANNSARIDTGVQVTELVMVASVKHEAKTLVNGAPVEIKGEKLHTFLHPAQPPAFRYRRNTVKIYGNVVRATHGETRNEVLGSGDGSEELQSFELRQPPLTHLAAPNPSGTESTLEVRVNNIRWREAPNLFVLSPNDRNYITKTDDDGKTTVIYGDGEHGARLPTGIENIAAVYRQGLGRDGNVKADQIKLPLTKPLGVKSVINPLPAGGGVDKETRDQARINAPIAVLALDRLVSVQDYADFAHSFAGIAKASARRLSDGVRDVVHLTIAGSGNIPIDVTSDLYRNLFAALRRFGDPLQPLEVDSFERVLLIVAAKVSVHPDHLWEVVKEKLRANLWEKLDFDNRELGQGVTLSEVLSLMQAVPGVEYVDFELLDSVTEEKLGDPSFGAKLTLQPRVNVALARMNKTKDDILPAQLLFLSREASDTLILEEVAK